MCGVALHVCAGSPRSAGLSIPLSAALPRLHLLLPWHASSAGPVFVFPAFRVPLGRPILRYCTHAPILWWTLLLGFRLPPNPLQTDAYGYFPALLGFFILVGTWLAALGGVFFLLLLLRVWSACACWVRAGPIAGVLTLAGAAAVCVCDCVIPA
jgi:hypothetical protein